MKILPVVGVSNPEMSRSIVVLPQPDGPNRVRNSPLCTSRLIFCNMSWPCMVLDTPRSSIILLVISLYFFLAKRECEKCRLWYGRAVLSSINWGAGVRVQDFFFESAFEDGFSSFRSSAVELK